MPDNILLGNNQRAATRIASHSGEPAHITLVEIVGTTGAEDSRTTTAPLIPVHVTSSDLTVTHRTTDSITTAHDVDTVMEGSTALAVKRVAFTASTSGNNTIVAAVTGKRICVLAYNLMSLGAVNAVFQTGAGGTSISGIKYLVEAGRGIAPGECRQGWFKTNVGALLNLNLSAAVAVSGEVVYVETTA